MNAYAAARRSATSSLASERHVAAGGALRRPVPRHISRGRLGLPPAQPEARDRALAHADAVALCRPSELAARATP